MYGIDRRPTLGAVRGPGRAAGLGDMRTRGSRLVRILLPLLLLVVVGWGLSAVSNRDEAPLADLVLVGPRGPACVRVVLASDVSGSMASVAQGRDAAIAELLRWVPDNLRPDDELASLAFAAEAGPARGPVSIGDLTAATSLTPGTAEDGRFTVWQPVLDAIEALPETECSTAVLVLSDAQLNPLPSDPEAARESLLAAGVDHLALLVPSFELGVPEEWVHQFPHAAPIRFEGTDQRATARAIAHVIATVTGQRLERA